MEILHKELSSKVIKAFYNVYNQLGYGFLEKVYEKAMMIELKKIGLAAIRQHPISVEYDEINVGNYYADILVDNKIILELKAEEAIHSKHNAQLVNYLKATQIEVGLLLNFGSKPEFSRKIFMNDNK